MERSIIGRKEETSNLQLALQSDRPELVAVIGRRRVGKTFLIKQTYGHAIDFELTGLQHAKRESNCRTLVLL